MEELLKKLELENLQVEKLENKIQAWPKNENS
jgi:uncharacterized protein YfeS